MGSYDYDLVCIGSGPAGQRAAIQAAKLGRRVAIVERRRAVGGSCVFTGTIPSKTFRQAAMAFTGLATGRGSGGVRRARPTAEDLLERVQSVVHAESEVVEDQLWRNDVEVFRGEGRFVGPHEIEVSNADDPRTRITSDRILIAVGTRPAPPPGISPEDAKGLIVTSDEVLSFSELPREMVVVGGGVIGVEYASIFGTLGVRVSVVEKRRRCMDFLDDEISDELVHQMRSRKVTFRFGEAVERLSVSEKAGNRPVVHLESGKTLLSDRVLYSIGRVGATDSLGLENVGLTVDDRGRLSVNENFQTAVPHIYAVGDCIGFPALAATSSEQGRLAARHALGRPTGPMAEHFPLGIYSVPEISMVGRTERQLTEEKVPYVTGIARYREIARGQILGDDTGLFKMLFGRDDGRLLGVHAIGTGATELIHIGQAVLVLGGGIDYFLDTVFNYPTLAECLKVAALDASNKLEAQMDITL